MMTTRRTNKESRIANTILLHHDGCIEGTDISRLKSPCSEIAIYRTAFGYEAFAGKTIARGVHAPVQRRLSPGEECLLSCSGITGRPTKLARFSIIIGFNVQRRENQPEQITLFLEERSTRTD